MFNDSMQGVNTLSLALANSAKEMIEANTFSDETDEKVSFFNDAGDIYVPIAKEYWKSNFPMMDPPEGSITTGVWNTFERFRDRMLSSNITTITFNEAVFLPTLLKQLGEENKVYGAVIENTDKFKGRASKFMFNPLHPINVFLIAAGVIKIPSSGKLHIFEYSDNAMEKFEENEESAKEFEKHYKDEYTKLFDKMAPKILKDRIVFSQKASINNSDVASIIENPFLESLTATIRLETKESESCSRDRIKSLIIPTQLAIDSMVTPYYGLMLIKNPTTPEAKGISLTPMHSGNLNNPPRSDRAYMSARNNPSSGNICVGSESIISRRGWFTLSKVNLGSMYYNNIIDNKSVLPFARASKKIAGEIWGTIEEEKLKQIDAEV